MAGEPAHKIEREAPSEISAEAQAFYDSMRRLGLSHDEALDDAPTDATTAEVTAWLQGDTSAPWPR